MGGARREKAGQEVGASIAAIMIKRYIVTLDFLGMVALAVVAVLARRGFTPHLEYLRRDQSDVLRSSALLAERFQPVRIGHRVRKILNLVKNRVSGAFEHLGDLSVV